MLCSVILSVAKNLSLWQTTGITETLRQAQGGGRIWILPLNCSRESHSWTFPAAKRFRGYKNCPPVGGVGQRCPKADLGAAKTLDSSVRGDKMLINETEWPAMVASHRSYGN